MTAISYTTDKQMQLLIRPMLPQTIKPSVKFQGRRDDKTKMLVNCLLLSCSPREFEGGPT
jgi:hypothetical protein